MSEVPSGTELDKNDIAELAVLFDLLAKFDQKDKAKLEVDAKI